MKDGLYVMPIAVKNGKIIPLKDMISGEEVGKVLAKSVIDALISILDPRKSNDTNGGE